MAGVGRYQYVSDQLLGTANCNEIVIALQSINTKWDTLGGHLNMPRHVLEEIAESHGSNHSRKMSDMIARWLRRPTPEHRPSWRVLCQALVAMEAVEVADKIAGIDNQSQPTSSNDSSVSGASSSVPSVSDLDEQLHDLIDWELFATHLPEINQHDITKIANDFHGRTDRQKLQLYKIWLEKCNSPSWVHVIGALKKIRNNKLVGKIENWLNEKREKATSRNGGQPMSTTLSSSTPLSTTSQTDALPHTESTDNGSEDYDSSDDGRRDRGNQSQGLPDTPTDGHETSTVIHPPTANPTRNMHFHIVIGFLTAVIVALISYIIMQQWYFN